jgi:RNase P subunit RPR2
MRTHKRRPAHILQKARAEVAALFDEAEALWRQGDEKLARRRVAQARKHAMKVQLRIPEQGDRFL